MKVEFKRSFLRDLKKVKDKSLKGRIRQIIELVEQAQSPQEIANLRKLRGGSNYFRIRVGDYRIGLIIESDIVIFVRLLHRKDIYRYFP